MSESRPARPGIAAFVLAALLLAGCGRGGPEPSLSASDRDRLESRAVSRAVEPPVPFERRAATVRTPLTLTLVAPMFGTLLGAAGQANESLRSSVTEIPAPGVDPAPIVETILAEHLARNFAAMPIARTLDASSLSVSGSRRRGPQLATLARAQGMPGVILDVHAITFRAASTGVRTGLRTEAFYLVLEAGFTLVDSADGAVLSAGTCSVDSRARARTLADIDAGGQGAIDATARVLAEQCAAQLILSLLGSAG